MENKEKLKELLARQKEGGLTPEAMQKLSKEIEEFFTDLRYGGGD